MGLVAFALTEEFAGKQEDGTPIYGGGQIAKIDGTTFDTAVALAAGKGTIVLEDMDPIAEQLRALPAFAEIDAPEGQPAASGDYLDGLNADQLRAEADSRGIPKGGTKLEIADRIREYDLAEEEETDAVDASGDSTGATEEEA